MNIYKTTRYPRSKKRAEGVDRAWLLSQLPNAKHPNVLIDIALRPIAPWAVAQSAKITEDVLIDFLLGKDSLSIQEARALGVALGNVDANVSTDYIFDENLTMLPGDEMDEYLQEAREAWEQMDHKHPVYKLLPELFNMRPLPWSIATAPHYFVEETEEDWEWGSRDKPRAVAMKEGGNDAA